MIHYSLNRLKNENKTNKQTEINLFLMMNFKGVQKRFKKHYNYSICLKFRFLY